MRALLAFAMIAFGCDGVFTCTQDAQCASAGTQGRCLQEAGGAYCAFAAGDCPAGLRCDNSAPSLLRGQCVGVSGAPDMAAPIGEMPSLSVDLSSSSDGSSLADLRSPDMAISCPMGQTACAGGCANLDSDSANCGACGNACSMKNGCAKGLCAPDYEWARWPMPNPAAAQLPNPSKYDSVSLPGVVTDQITGLSWQQDYVGGNASQAMAIAGCTALLLQGGRWRLPTIIELVSLIDYTQDTPALDPIAFNKGSASYLWSSSLVAGDPNQAWNMQPAGEVRFDNAGDSKGYRCVR